MPQAGSDRSLSEESSPTARRGKRYPKSASMTAALIETLLPPEERPRVTSQQTERSDSEEAPRSCGAEEDSAADTRETPKSDELSNGTSPARSAAYRRPRRRRRHFHTIHERFLDRDAPFGQSSGHWAIHNDTTTAESTSAVKELFRMDWYHAFLDTKFYIQMSIFGLAYVTSFCVFGSLFLLISEPCGLELEGNFVSAYLFALESMMTIGYGAPDPFMRGCWQAVPVMTTMTLLQVLMTACLIGVIFQGISRPQARACTILFSENAVIRCVDGAYYLMFRVCDLRIRHSLIEAHVRCYCVHQDPDRGCELMPMRLEHPDDDLNGALLLTLPYVVVHRIDAWSPLAPRQSRPRLSGSLPSPCARELHRTACWPGTHQRQVDCESGNRNSYLCPTCGESFGTVHMLRLHCRYGARADEVGGQPAGFCHEELQADDLQGLGHQDPTREEIVEHLSQGYHEVVVLVEGIEPTTSSTLQARHSYVVGGRGLNDTEAVDVRWDKDFDPHCVRVRQCGKGGVSVDLGLFHSLVD